MSCSILLDACSGHFQIPGGVPSMGLVRSFPEVPPSVMRGCLESFCGLESGSFANSKSAFTYGRTVEPRGYGKILRNHHVWSGANEEKWRPQRVETYFGLSYRVVVEGAFEETLRKALRGETSGYGCLYLGRSDDIVSALVEGTKPARWVIPGTTWNLPIKVGHGFSTVTKTIYGQFTLTENFESDPPPLSHWIKS